METFYNIDWAAMAIKVAYALIILIVTALIAMLVKRGLSKLVTSVPTLRRQGAEGHNLGDAIGQIGSLIVWLFGLIAILNLFSLNQVLGPIQGMLNTFLAYLPNIVGAALLFVVGFLLAKIAKQLIETTLKTLGVDRWAEKASRVSAGAPVVEVRPGETVRVDSVNPMGATTTTVRAADVPADVPAGASAHVRDERLAQAAGAPAADRERMSLSSVIANVVFAVIVIVVAIAALQVLGIAAISVPAAHMLQIILDSIPRIIAAGILLALGVVIGRFVGQLVEGILRSLNVDGSLAELGIMQNGGSASRVLGRIAQVAVILFFAVMATNMLGFPQVTAMLNEILRLGGRVLFGAVIIAAGLMIAKLLRRLIGGNGLGGKIIQWATVVLFVAMGLQFMGLATSIINLAFGALVIGAGVAAALAFGLGGRDAASRLLNKAERKIENETNV